MPKNCSGFLALSSLCVMHRLLCPLAGKVLWRHLIWSSWLSADSFLSERHVMGDYVMLWSNDSHTSSQMAWSPIIAVQLNSKRWAAFCCNSERAAAGSDDLACQRSNSLTLSNQHSAASGGKASQSNMAELVCIFRDAHHSRYSRCSCSA
ncbi:hypothetical protein EDD16DRAFT_1587484 [Pisolithus croceorrhizus]|nr:hypothetical protein EDD16DRAFT_1587484 [Pisolithus croceorrhizus]